MNYYFLLEDEKSFTKILPKWLDFIGFGCTRVQNYECLTTNSYVLESGRGIIQLENNAIFNTIDTIRENTKSVDKLIIIADAEDIGAAERKERIFNAIYKEYPPETESIPCSIHIFVCNRCVETWLLGCMGLYPSSPELISDDFASYYDFYDIEHCDPENMLKPSSHDKSIATYHFQYLHTLTLDIQKQNKLKGFAYTKSKPNCALRQDYFEAMLRRIGETDDIGTFKEFYDFIVAEKEHNK